MIIQDAKIEKIVDIFYNKQVKTIKKFRFILPV